MKNRAEMKKILGLTQNEMAMLLGVSRSSWTMFKSGQRDIPLASKKQLAYLMETSAKRKKVCREVEMLLKNEIKYEKVSLKQELITTEFKIKMVIKEIENLIRMRENLFAAYETAVLLDSEDSNPKAKLLSETLKTRVKNSLNKYNLAILTTLQLKKESLEMLKLQIDKKLNL